jgi:tetraacyldisaccharide 4'-kinase
MDDGLQNPQLAKSLRIAVVDAGKGLGNGRIIPAGPLRAPLDVQLRATDVVVLNSMTAHDTAGQIEVLTTRLRAAGFTGKVLTASVQATGDPGWLRGQTVVAVSGIARPERFHALLEAAGAHLVAREAFPDHHPFDQADARRLLTVAEAAGAAIVTTAKDAARLSGSTGALADLRRAARVVEIALQMPPDAAAGLEACLAAAAPVT